MLGSQVPVRAMKAYVGVVLQLHSLLTSKLYVSYRHMHQWLLHACGRPLVHFVQDAVFSESFGHF